ncbi:hypothetical protein K438DRAFT_1979453 [Mycena galopus ATCC 62051]|nr:hypothetical protein K438DRAFT_1979453 [Mycena galopus ATCC 62051]
MSGVQVKKGRVCALILGPLIARLVPRLRRLPASEPSSSIAELRTHRFTHCRRFLAQTAGTLLSNTILRHRQARPTFTSPEESQSGVQRSNLHNARPFHTCALFHSSLLQLRTPSPCRCSVVRAQAGALTTHTYLDAPDVLQSHRKSCAVRRPLFFSLPTFSSLSFDRSAHTLVFYGRPIIMEHAYGTFLLSTTMAEAIGLIASIVQLVDTVATAGTMLKDLHNASEQQEQLLCEMSSLQPLLSALRERLISNNASVASLSIND